MTGLEIGTGQVRRENSGESFQASEVFSSVRTTLSHSYSWATLMVCGFWFPCTSPSIKEAPAHWSTNLGLFLTDSL